MQGTPSTETIWKLDAECLAFLNAGESVVTEDFVPTPEGSFLLTCGPNFRRLNYIVECRAEWKHPACVLSEPVVLAEGSYLRLGNRHRGELIYSEGFNGPHQPYRSDRAYYYADGAPDATVHIDGEVFFRWGPKFAESGKPWEHDGMLYFEANRLHESPSTWEIWRCNLNTRMSEKVCDGANPAVLGTTLFYGKWKGDGEYGFHLVTRTL